MVGVTFFISIFILVYTWFGYLLLLRLFVKLCSHENILPNNQPFVTVVLTVHNEQEVIGKRIDNLLAQDYPKELYDVLVASDGSTDETNDLIRLYAKNHRRVRLYETNGGGKSATQNNAIPLAMGDIIVLTDAGTTFEVSTLNYLVKSFSQTSVGCVTGRLMLNQPLGAVAGSQGMYWRFETTLRGLESKIGALHTASGQIMAFRKNLFRPFGPMYGDDCIIPLDIIMQGYRVVHEDSAIAYDSFPSTPKGELKARTRMTLRNITCTLSKNQLLNPFKYPFISLAIISHKLLRWLTPFFMLTALFTNIFLLGENTFYLLSGIAQGLFYVLGAAGFIGELCKVRIPVASQIFSFLLANAGFFLGVLKAISGKHVTSYKNHEPCHGA